MIILPEFGALVTSVTVLGVQEFDKRNDAEALLSLAAKFKRLDIRSRTGILDVRRDFVRYALCIFEFCLIENLLVLRQGIRGHGVPYFGTPHKYVRLRSRHGWKLFGASSGYQRPCSTSLQDSL